MTTTTPLLRRSPLPAGVVPGTGWRWLAGVVCGAIALSAYAGSWYLTDGSALEQLPVPPPESLPGAGWEFGAFALLLLVAAPMTVACLTAAFGHRSAAASTVVAGSLLVVWIVAQVLLIGLLSPLQPLLLAVGAFVLALGAWAYHPSSR